MPVPTPRQASIIIEAGKRVDDGAFDPEIADEPAFKILCDQICEHAWNLCRTASVEAAEALASGNSRHPSIAVAEMWQDACDAAWKVQGALRERRTMRQAAALPMSNFELGSANGSMGKSMSPQGPRGVQPGGWFRHPGAASSLVSQRRKGPADADAERYMRSLYTDMPAPKLLVSDGSTCHEPMDVVKGLGMPTHDQRVWATRVEKIIKGARIEVDFRKSLYATLREHSGELPKFAREEIGRRALSLYRTSKHGSISKAFPQPGQQKPQPGQKPQPQKPQARPPQKGAMPERIKIHPPGRDVPSSDDAANGKGARSAPQKSPGAVREQHFKEPGLDVSDLAGGPTDNGVITAEIEKLHKQLHALHAHMDGSPAQIHLHNDLVAKMREVYAKPDPEGLRHVKHMLHHFAEILQGPEEPDPSMMEDPQNPQMGGGGPPGAGKPQPFNRAKGPPQKGQKPPAMGKSLRPFEAGRFALARGAAFSESEEFEKGATHKYLRRIPTGKQKPKYRYIYNVNSAARAGGGGEATPKVGEKVLVPHAGVRGHFEVREVRADGRIRAEHDETGQEIILHKNKFHDLIAHSHEEGLKAKHDAEDALPKNKMAAYRMLLQSSGIPDHDLAQADAAYTEWKSRGRASKSDKPKAWRGGELDGMRREIGGKKAKGITSMAEAFEILTRNVSTWRDLKEKVIPAMRETPGFEHVRIPMEAMTRHAFQDEERRSHDDDFRPENYGDAVGDSHEDHGGPEATFDPDEFARSLVENFTLLKAREHKYLRRIPTGKMKPKYRYVYSIASQAHDSVPSVGEKVRITDDGKEGHYEVKHVDGDEVHLEHDESHRKLVVRRGHLHDLFKREHERALVAKHAELRRIASQANATGTAGQQSLATANLRAFERTFGLQSQAKVPEAPASGEPTKAVKAPASMAASQAPAKKRGWNEIADELRRTDKLVDAAVDSEARAVLIEKRAALTREQAALAAASGDHERAARMERLAKNDDENARGERAHTVYSNALKAAGDYSGKDAEEHAKLLDAVADAAEAWGHPRAMEKVEQYRRNAKIVREKARPPAAEPMSVADAKKAGREAHAQGLGMAPALNAAFLDRIPKGEIGSANAHLKAYADGWMAANLAAPVPDDDAPEPAGTAPETPDAAPTGADDPAQAWKVAFDEEAEAASEADAVKRQEARIDLVRRAHEIAKKELEEAEQTAAKDGTRENKKKVTWRRHSLDSTAEALKDAIEATPRLAANRKAIRDRKREAAQKHEAEAPARRKIAAEAKARLAAEEAKKREKKLVENEKAPKRNRQREREVGAHIEDSAKDRADERRLIEKGDLADMPFSEAHRLVNKNNAMPVYALDHFKARGSSPGAAHLALSMAALVGSAPPEDSDASRRAYLDGIRLVRGIMDSASTVDDFDKARRELSELTKTSIWGGTASGRPIDIIHTARETKGGHGDSYEGINRPIGNYAKEVLEPRVREKNPNLRVGYRFTEDGAEFFTYDPAETQSIRESVGALGKRFYDQFVSSGGKIWNDARTRATEAERMGAAGWDHLEKTTEQKKEAKRAERAEREEHEEGTSGKEAKLKWRQHVDEKPAVIAPKVAVPSGDAHRLQSTFGFNAEQPGATIPDAELNHHRKYAEMAFHDLADVLGIDPKHVSMKGRLALAFAARGTGKARAHYEPEKKVINITRFAGAGSLAHEWGHFLDNVVAEQHRAADSTKGRVYGSAGDHGTMAPEVRAAFAKFKKLITTANPKTIKTAQENLAKAKADFASAAEQKRALTRELYAMSPDERSGSGAERVKEIRAHAAHLDEVMEIHVGRAKGAQAFLDDPVSDYMQIAKAHDGKKYGTKDAYWTADHEMFARAFESFIQDKLEDNGRRNSYLVDGTRPRGEATDALAPYPQADERKALNSMFEELIGAMRKNGSFEKALRFIIDLRKARARR